MATWCDFVVELYLAGVLRFDSPSRVQIGCFFVTKKSGRLRLIVDCRRTNKLFRRAPRTVLGSIESWSRLRMSKSAKIGSQGAKATSYSSSSSLPTVRSDTFDYGSNCEAGDMFVAQEDVRDCFYCLGIAPELSAFFGLPDCDFDELFKAFRRRDLSVPEVVHSLHNQSLPIVPQMQVLPMGFSWAFHLAHEAHRHLASLALPATPFLCEREVVPDVTVSRPILMIYADNANHIGLDSSIVDSNRKTLSQMVNHFGLSTHDIVSAGLDGESLGIRYCGSLGVLQCTPERDALLDQSLTAILTGALLSGDQLGRIIGHVTHRFLLKRPLLSSICHCYAFMAKVGGRLVEPWPSVLQELRTIKALLPFVYADLRLPVHDTVRMYDASLSGYGVVEATAGDGEIRSLFDRDESWRFQDESWAARNPRAAALDVYASVVESKPDPWDFLFDVDTVLPVSDEERLLYEDFSFPNVPPLLLVENRWKKLWVSPLVFHESVHLCEARAALSGIKHISRNALGHNMHHALLGDNLGVVLACSKGRCSDRHLLRTLRRCCAEIISANIVVHHRWVPSELNRADGISRLWEIAKPMSVSLSFKTPSARAVAFRHDGRGGRGGSPCVFPSSDREAVGQKLAEGAIGGAEPLGETGSPRPRVRREASSGLLRPRWRSFASSERFL